MIQNLDNRHVTERETRAILKKAGKRIGQFTAQNAVCESKIYSLESKIEELQGLKTRKRVVVDLNIRFANIDAIKKGIDEAAEQKARIKARQLEKEVKRTADELAKAKMQDFMFEWQAI
jgi:succinate dehydrogenase/fumarate reductase-like Fe-S protein